MAFLVLFAAACGGSSVEWAGKWKQPTTIAAGSYMEMSLAGSGTTITGTGVQNREAGQPSNFTVKGSAASGGAGPYVDLTYDDATTEHFSFAQPDADHITLQNPQRTVNLVRE